MWPLRGFAECLSTSRRVRLDLAGLEPEAIFPAPAARVILNLVLLAAESMPGGGTVALSGSPAASILVTMPAHAPPGRPALRPGSTTMPRPGKR